MATEYFNGLGWWARQGSNLRPIGYEPTALPLSYRPSLFRLYTGESPVKHNLKSR